MLINKRSSDCEKSRMLPWNFDPAMAWRQLGNFVRMLQSYAADAGIRVALLPLRRSIATTWGR